jgi:hypothetical protein
MELVDDIKKTESTYMDHGVYGHCRLFLLGFYVRLANIQNHARLDNEFTEIKISEQLHTLLNLSEGRTKKIDWLVLILMHLTQSLGEEKLMILIKSGQKFNEIYELMSIDERENMLTNCLAYGASINEPDFFLYEKV